jgi:hypothetical protein
MDVFRDIKDLTENINVERRNLPLMTVYITQIEALVLDGNNLIIQMTP